MEIDDGTVRLQNSIKAVEEGLARYVTRGAHQRVNIATWGCEKG
jgi:hypothetical protein